MIAFILGVSLSVCGALMIIKSVYTKNHIARIILISLGISLIKLCA